MSKIGLIIAREYTTRVRKKTFILMTVLGPLLMGVFLWGAVWLGKKDDKVNKVLVSDPLGLFKGYMESNPHVKFDFEKRNIDDKEFLSKKYEDHNLFLQIPEDPIKNKVVRLVYRSKPGSSVEAYIHTELNNAVERLRVEDAKIDPKLYEEIKSVKVLIKAVDIKDLKNEKSPYLSVLGFFCSIIIYLFIFLYGAQVMRGVIEEKTSRVVEVIVSSVSTFQLMMGKIIGIALVGLTQFLVWIGLMFVILTLMKNSMVDQYDAATMTAQNVQAQVTVQNGDLFSLIFEQINYGAILSIFLFYFIAGYLLYASLFAAVGSAVDNETDTQQFMLPISVPLIFAYIISVMGIDNPEGPAQVWCSFIPFTSPVSMMVRVVTGTVPGWQVAISMVLLIGTFIFTTWVAGKIYRTGILMYGKKASYREMWKWMRYKG